MVYGTIRNEPNGRYTNTQTQDVTYGDTTYVVKLITKKNRLLCPMDMCQKRFDDARALKLHLNVVHDVDGQRANTCPVCGDTFTLTPSAKPQTCCSKSCGQRHRNSDSQ